MLLMKRKMEDRDDLIFFKRAFGEKLSQLKLKELEFDSEDIEQRGKGDKVERILSRFIEEMKTTKIQILPRSSKRSFEDLSIKLGDFNIALDFKSHDVDANFSRPNLKSIERIKKFLKNDSNHLWYVFVDYKSQENKTTILNIEVRSPEELPWECLDLGNIGRGQIQIKDKNIPINFREISRSEWLKELSINKIKFLDKQINKFQKNKIKEIAELAELSE